MHSAENKSQRWPSSRGRCNSATSSWAQAPAPRQSRSPLSPPLPWVHAGPRPLPPREPPLSGVSHATPPLTICRTEFSSSHLQAFFLCLNSLLLSELPNPRILYPQPASIFSLKILPLPNPIKIPELYIPIFLTDTRLLNLAPIFLEMAVVPLRLGSKPTGRAELALAQ